LKRVLIVGIIGVTIAVCARQDRASASDDKIIAEYAGYYVCAQGVTGLILDVFNVQSNTSPNATFKFGPTASNPAVPSGAFLLRGIVDVNGGALSLLPVSWLSRPFLYTMDGLHGVSNDGGNTFEGTVISGVGCTDFSVHRVFTSAPSALPAPPGLTANSSGQQPGVRLRNSDSDNGRSEISLQRQGGTLVVPVSINNVLTLNFVIDSGASDVSIPADVVLTLIRAGTIHDADFLGTKRYRLADGSTVPSSTFRIRSLKAGDREVANVTASIGKVEGGLLLGQSFLNRFKSWSIDNDRQVLLLN
jgi:hypothetical protein